MWRKGREEIQMDDEGASKESQSSRSTNIMIAYLLGDLLGVLDRILEV